MRVAAAKNWVFHIFGFSWLRIALLCIKMLFFCVLVFCRKKLVEIILFLADFEQKKLSLRKIFKKNSSL